MKSYKRIHGIAYCEDCEFKEEGFIDCVKLGEKHHKETGHQINIELGFWRQIERKEQNDKL